MDGSKSHTHLRYREVALFAQDVQWHRIKRSNIYYLHTERKFTFAVIKKVIIEVDTKLIAIEKPGIVRVKLKSPPDLYNCLNRLCRAGFIECEPTAWFYIWRISS